MAKYTIESEYCSVFGMDVHARTTTVKGLDRSTGVTATKRFNDAPTPAEIASWMKQGFTGPWYAAYESGCTGFHLCRELRGEGIGCDVIAVSSIARSVDDRQRKNDSRDAARLLAEITSIEPTCSAVWTPDTETEAMRDLVRERFDAADAVKAAKQQAGALLLRHGLVWNEKTPTGTLKGTWTGDYVKWAESADLGEPASSKALEHALTAVEDARRRLREIEGDLDAFAEQPRWKPYVDAISLLNGVGRMTAIAIACEIGRFHRFSAGRDVSKWLGTVPSHSESAEKGSHGGITKAGNSICRTSLVEGASNLCRRSHKQKKPRAGQVVSPEVQAVCRKANSRLVKRYEHLVANGKHANKAKVAVVNELIRWIWVIGCMVEDEQAAESAQRRA